MKAERQEHSSGERLGSGSKKKPFSVLIPVTDKERLEDLAAARGVSCRALVRQIVLSKIK